MMISKRSVELYNTPTAALEKLKIKLMKDKDNTHTKAKTTTTKYRRTREGRQGNNNINHDCELSKASSWELQHGAPVLNITISSDGYVVPLSALLSCKARSLNTYTQQDVERVVQSKDKQLWYGNETN